MKFIYKILIEITATSPSGQLGKGQAEAMAVPWGVYPKMIYLITLHPMNDAHHGMFFEGWVDEGWLSFYP